VVEVVSKVYLGKYASVMQATYAVASKFKETIGVSDPTEVLSTKVILTGIKE
jgi:hypothetical protein